jgi:hypothetical protein
MNVVLFLVGFAATSALSSQSRCFIDPVWNASELLWTKNKEYGSAFNALTKQNETLYMDLWAPPPDSDKRKMRPTIVLVHGGSFVSGDKEGFKSLGEILAARGFIVVSFCFPSCYIFLIIALPGKHQLPSNRQVLGQQAVLPYHRW